MKCVRVKTSPNMNVSNGGDVRFMYACKSQHACLKYVLNVQFLRGQKWPDWSIVGNLTNFVQLHIRYRIPHKSISHTNSVHQTRRVKHSYASLKALIANHVLHGFDTGFVHSSILYARYCSTFLIATNTISNGGQHKTKGWHTQNELHHNLAEYLHIWTHRYTKMAKMTTGGDGVNPMCLHWRTNQSEYTQFTYKMENWTQIAFLGYTLKLSKTSMRIHCVINMNQVIESLADMGFCDRSGNPKPNFRYYQDSQYSAIARVSAILRGLACYYDLAEMPHDKRRCMTRWCYILTHSLAMVFAAKFKLGTRACVFGRAGRNLQKPISAKKHTRR